MTTETNGWVAVMEESYATLLEVVADIFADSVAVVHGENRRTWAELDERAARLATYLENHGVGPRTRVGISLYNSAEYVETIFAILKLGATPVNINYRYREAELAHILTDSNAAAVVLDQTLLDRMRAVAPQVPSVQTLIVLGEPGDGGYEAAIAASAAAPRRARSADDEWLLYTGGTTGVPRAVATTQRWLIRQVSLSCYGRFARPIPGTLEEFVAMTRQIRESGESWPCLPTAPLMHGAGIYNTLSTLLGGGPVVYLSSRSYDPHETAALIEAHRVANLAIVGDVFALPLADALDEAAAAGHPYDLSSLKIISSVGLTWSAEVKTRLLAHGDFDCTEVLSATEGGPFARASSRADGGVFSGRFTLAAGARLITEDGRDVGVGELGLLAAPTDGSVHYLGDDERSRTTFRQIGDTRYVVAGDLALLQADGSLLLRGRGSQVINTGGEKVFGGEVEQAIARHAQVSDVMVVGVADPRWGERIAAVVATKPGTNVTLAELRDFVGQQLADYKRPSVLVCVPELRRSPAGKADLTWAREVAIAEVNGASTPG